MKKSIVLSAAFPSVKADHSRLWSAIDMIRPFDFSVVEYYIAGSDADKVASMMSGWESVFLSAALQKEAGLNPSSCDHAERAKAVELLADSMRFAEQAGAGYVLVNSGARPEDERLDEACLLYLRESLCELHGLADGVGILLEPGDRDIEYRHLLGHTSVADAFIRDISREIPNIGMVFDTSHIAQLGEKLYDAWDIAEQSCLHIHLANCSLTEGSRYFGDKHPLFSIGDGVYSHSDLLGFYRHVMNRTQSLTVGVEIICRDEPEEDFFHRMVSETDWFFELKPC